MKNLKHPNFLLGLLALALAGVALGFRNNKYDFDYYIAIGAVVVGFTHWIWSIIEVYNTKTLVDGQKIFWQIAVTAIPLGGLFYYILHNRSNAIVD